jgi:2-polyprenyl-3-methyl-5-hydroxy-6-metoxy-1,4-benzoquinol methylase
MINWTDIHSDPNNSEAKHKVHLYLQSIRYFEKRDNNNMRWLADKVAGKACLDIGAVGHDLAKVGTAQWKHQHIANYASRVIGIDIEEEYVEKVRAQGFDVRVCDATSKEYLGETFDVVVLGDVIEHVENPIDLIRFGLRHLNSNGEIVASTPNPYYYDRLKNMRRNRPFVNLSHIAWFTPTMALEIARRADCVLNAYFVNTKEQPWYTGFRNPEFYSRNYIYCFMHKQNG